MVKLMRVDDRMIHGQVATSWCKALDIKALVVANDKAAKDKTQVMVLKMAGPPGCKVAVRSIEDAITMLNDPRSDPMSMSVIITNIEDALRIAQGATDKIKRINLGNYGRLNEGDALNKRKLSNNVYVDDKDLEMIEGLKATGIPVDVQILPYMAMVTIDDALK